MLREALRHQDTTPLWPLLVPPRTGNSGRSGMSTAQAIAMLPLPTRQLRGDGHQGHDVQWPSVCYEYVLLSLVSKETGLAYGRANYSQAVNSERYREKGGVVREMPAAGGEARCDIMPQPWGNTQIKMGQFKSKRYLVISLSHRPNFLN